MMDDGFRTRLCQQNHNDHSHYQWFHGEIVYVQSFQT